MIYDEAVAALMTMLEIPLNFSDENFQRILPRAFEYSDNRIYRELNFLVTETSTTSIASANNREMAVPTNVIATRYINVVTPVGAIGNTSVRHQPERISPEVLDVFWPQGSALPGVPQKYAMIGNRVAGPPEAYSFTLRFGPEPDAGYTVEFVGRIRPAIVSPTNNQTYLTANYPDLWLSCCLVFLSAYQRDFGAMAEDPAKAMAWEGVYKSQRDSVMLEAGLQRGEAPGWSNAPPAPMANQARAP